MNTNTVIGARVFGQLFLGMLAFAIVSGVSLLLSHDDLAEVRSRVVRRLSRSSPSWLLEAMLAVAAAAYVVIGAAPLLHDLPFFYASFPFGLLVALLLIAGGFAVLLLRFL